jgi:hypothetical protein
MCLVSLKSDQHFSKLVINGDRVLILQIIQWTMDKEANTEFVEEILSEIGSMRWVQDSHGGKDIPCSSAKNKNVA